MTANPSNLGALLYADESSFAEVSTTFDERLPIVNSTADMVAGLEQSSFDYDPTLQYQNDAKHDARMVTGGSFTIELMLTGHGSATTGAVTASVLGTFLQRVIGNIDVSNVGTTVSTGTDADTFTATGGTIGDYSLIRLGAISDGEGNGQFYAVSDGSGPVELLNAASGTPVAAAVVYAPEMIYPGEDPTTGSAVTSMRFQIQTANQRYNCFGCYPTSLEITGTNPGELPRVRVTMGVSSWAAESASTWPTVTSTDFFSPSPVAAGSLFINDVGTTTRATVDARDVTVGLNLVNVPLTGQEGPRDFQAVVGVRRVACNATLSFTLDREAAGTDTWGDWWNTKLPAYQHAMLTLSAVDTCAVGLYFPKLKRMGPRPTQQDRQGLNSHTVTFQAVTGGTTTNALSLANFILALG